MSNVRRSSIQQGGTKMNKGSEALKLAAWILLRCTAVGVMFAAAALFLKHAGQGVVLGVFLVPVAIGCILAAAVLLPLRARGRGKRER